METFFMQQDFKYKVQLAPPPARKRILLVQAVKMTLCYACGISPSPKVYTLE